MSPALEVASHAAAAAAYLALGRFLVRRLRLDVSGGEALAWSWALGTGVASLGILLLAATRVWTVTGAGPLHRLAWVVVPVAALVALARVPAPPERERRRDPWAALPLVAGAALALWSLAPDVGWDALAYHLPIAARIARDGAGATFGMLDGEYRAGFDLLWAPAIDLEGTVRCGPALLHALCACALAAAVHAEVRRRAGPLAAALAATLFVLSPGVTWSARSAYVDLAVGLYGFLALGAAARAVRGAPGPHAALAGLFAGFAANAKLSGASWIAVAVVALVAGLGFRKGARAAAVAAAAGAGVAAPWVVRAALDMGNPFFPFLLDRFGSGWADASVVRAVRREILEQADVPRGPFYGLVGAIRATLDRGYGLEVPPWIPAFLPAAFARRLDPATRALVVGALAATVAWLWLVPFARFGLGPLAWAAVAAAVGAARLATSRAARGLLVAAAALLLALDVRYALRPQYEGMIEPRRAEAAIARTLPTPVGLEGGIGGDLALVGVDAIGLEPRRNGILSDEDAADPERLLRGVRRLGLRALVVRAPEYVAAARAWAARGLATEPSAPDAYGWRAVVLTPPR